MQYVQNTQNQPQKEFDFVAFSLARMNSQGREMNMEQVTGSMDVVCKTRFLESYRYYLNRFIEK
ncbi:glycogen synthesis protein GlgS [Cedecea colo]|uniref:Glycogen synthesis protein GlgS n=1 Tax=Cedecea colo TaxID=2552946 RepID=A0ABX0VGV3_9ENTR|nr:glycogen synthesis protein GlgS [Cedecea colo]NIY46247.1 glycogen synthesis protein GlgS [Cedecea colo]